MIQSQFGMIGLGVMGSNLALNIADHGFRVAVWNREPEKTVQFCAANPDKPLVATKTLQELVNELEKPRRIMMMIKAGAPVDEMLGKLLPLLEEGDVVIDGGNSWFKDTQLRAAHLPRRPTLLSRRSGACAPPGARCAAGCP